MIINKITSGFVVQQWDTEKKAWIGQEFVAGEGCDVEYAELLAVYPDKDPAEAMDESNGGVEPYLNFDMVQPNP